MPRTAQEILDNADELAARFERRRTRRSPRRDCTADRSRRILGSSRDRTSPSRTRSSKPATTGTRGHRSVPWSAPRVRPLVSATAKQSRPSSRSDHRHQSAPQTAALSAHLRAGDRSRMCSSMDAQMMRAESGWSKRCRPATAHRAARIQGVGLEERFADLQPTSERAGLTDRLDEARRAVVAQAADLSHDELHARPLAATNLSIGRLVKHLAFVEDRWFHHKLRGLRASGTLAINQRQRGSRVVVPLR